MALSSGWVVSFFLLIQWHDYIPTALKSHWFILIATLITAALPQSQKSIPAQKDQPHYTFKQWLRYLTALQLGMYGLFIPLWLTQPYTEKTSLAMTLKPMLFQWGLFPWALYALFAVVLARNSYLKNRPGQLSALTHRLLNPLHHKGSDTAIDFALRMLPLLALSSTLGLFGWMTAQMIAHLGTKLDHPSALTLVVATALIGIIFNKTFNKALRTLIARKLSFAIISLSLVTLIGSVIGAISVLHPLQGIPQQSIYVSIGISFWWLSWTPLFSGTLATLSAGRSLRTLLLTPLVLPSLLILATPLLPDLSPHSMPIYRGGLWCISLISLYFTLKTLMQSPWREHLERGILPFTTTLKPRTGQHYFRFLIQMAVLIVAMALPTGWMGISLLLFPATLPGLLFILISLVKQ